ncbi:MAG: rRNA maturation RNase YbeY [Anaerosomatales bacterium]|nr:rRNA maturation RNase YbeY [Anaerosomatales bacterium]MDT8433526.1 rRNA maturation RNase YbeY [Anaerosomatales bacterium]
MPISITSHRDPEPLDLAAFERLAEFVLDREDVPAHAELSLALVDVDEMAELNEGYRGVAGPTDVLSFECDDPCPVESDEPVTLGDVVIAPRIAEEQAAELGHTVEEELNLLLVHGILHLLGYDHDSDEDAAVMQEREQALLAAYAEGL